jgi:hypothetical protein
LALTFELPLTSDFVRANPVLTIRQEPHGAKPLIKTDWGILEDRPDLNGKLFLAVKALPHEASFKERMPLGFATWARRTLRTPFGPGYNFQADFGVRKHLDGIHQAAGITKLSRFHELSISGDVR